MNIKQQYCKVCGNSTFYVYEIPSDIRIRFTDIVCAKCGAHNRASENI